MVNIWKFNCSEANGRVCEDGIGDGGVLILADTRDDALNKLYIRCKEDHVFAVNKLPLFGDEEDVNYDDDNDDIDWVNILQTKTKDEWMDKLERIMNASSTYAFLVKFPTHNII